MCMYVCVSMCVHVTRMLCHYSNGNCCTSCQELTTKPTIHLNDLQIIITMSGDGCSYYESVTDVETVDPEEVK